MAVSGDLSDELKDRIKQALIDYASTEEGVAVLSSIYNITAFGEPNLDSLQDHPRRGRAAGLRRLGLGDPDWAGPARGPARQTTCTTVIRFSMPLSPMPGGVHALRELTLDNPDGQMLVIVGLSGAGKSTLIRAINGLVP